MADNSWVWLSISHQDVTKVADALLEFFNVSTRHLYENSVSCWTFYTYFLSLSSNPLILSKSCRRTLLSILPPSLASITASSNSNVNHRITSVVSFSSLLFYAPFHHLLSLTAKVLVPRIFQIQIFVNCLMEYLFRKRPKLLKTLKSLLPLLLDQWCQFMLTNGSMFFKLTKCISLISIHPSIWIFFYLRHPAPIM